MTLLGGYTFCKSLTGSNSSYMTDQQCSFAAGGYFRGDWFYLNFSLDNPAWSCLYINHKETLAIVLAAKRWGHLWENHLVIIYSDNQAAMQIINKGTMGNKVIMQELRVLFMAFCTP